MGKNLSANGAHFISVWEGWRSQPYNDAANNATIGFGHLIHMGPVTPADVKKWGTITLAKGYVLLEQDAAKAVAAVNQYVKVDLTQAQFDALVDFCYNCGGGAINSNVGIAVNAKPKAWNLLAIRRWHTAVKVALCEWDHAGGQVLPGLYRRRLDESNLFATGKYITA